MEKLCVQDNRCGHCGCEYYRKISSELAMFYQRRIWSEPCPECQSLNVKEFFIERPSLDIESIEQWCKDADLKFDNSSEGHTLSCSEEHISLFLKLLDDASLFEVKRLKLFKGLCFMILVNLPEDGEPDDANKRHVVNEVVSGLSDRLDLFTELGSDFLDSEQTEILYPLIGLTTNADIG